MFAGGAFSAQPRPIRCGPMPSVLESLTGEALGRHFQVTEDNPLAGVDGRAALLRRLGAAVAAQPEIFARVDAPRPGGLFDHLAALAEARLDRRACHPQPSCCATWARYGRRGSSSAASRSATAGATRP